MFQNNHHVPVIIKILLFNTICCAVEDSARYINECNVIVCCELIVAKGIIAIHVVKTYPKLFENHQNLYRSDNCPNKIHDLIVEQYTK